MDWIEIFGIAVGLAADAFAISIFVGIVIYKITAAHIFRISFHFGLFQFLMPIVGWLTGNLISDFLDPWERIIAGGLLFLIAMKMFIESFSEEIHDGKSDPSRGWMLISLSVATSIDAFAAGLSMALRGVNVLMPAITVGVVTAIICVAGICLGRKLGSGFGRYAIYFGVLVLVAIGAKVIWLD